MFVLLLVVYVGNFHRIESECSKTRYCKEGAKVKVEGMSHCVSSASPAITLIGADSKWDNRSLVA